MLTDPVALVAREVARIRRDDRLRVAAWGAAWGLGAFATLPLAAGVSRRRAQVGVRYSSPVFTAGAVTQPATNSLAALWLCGRHEGMTRAWRAAAPRALAAGCWLLAAWLAGWLPGRR